MNRHTPFGPSRSFRLFILSMLFSGTFAVTATAADEAQPPWYREGPTVGDTLLDSKIELSKLTERRWAEAGFKETSGRPFPRFLELPNYWSHREIEDRRKTYEFPTAGRRKLYLGLVDRFGGHPFNRECKIYAVDGQGNQTQLDHETLEEGKVARREMRTHNHPQVWEYEFTLPSNTEKLLIEDLNVSEIWQMGWIDEQSRIELAIESFNQFGQLARLIETAARRDPELGRLGNREANGAKVCYGLFDGYADLARRYYWDLPAGQQEAIDKLVKDRSKIDRATLLRVRDRFVRYFAVLEPKLREYRDLRVGGQVHEFKELIEQAEGIPRTKQYLARLDQMRAEASDVERSLNEGRDGDFPKAERILDELQKIKLVFDLECKLKLARLTLEYVEKSKALPEQSAALGQLATRVEKAKPTEFETLIQQLKTLRRAILFEHPDLQFEKLLICKNHRPGPGHMCDQYLGRHTRPGKGLFVVENWLSDEPVETCITEELPEGYYHHPDLSFDGKRVAFAFCDTTVRESRHKRHWIYEAAIDGSGVRQLSGTIDDPMQRVDGRKTVVIEDWDPCYLPDGGFAFVSTRSQSYGRCHGSRYVPAFLMYRMDADGSNIRRLSFGEANEWDPAVLPDGRIVFTRWDYINRHDTRYQGLWTTHTDGTKTAHYYGSYSPSPCMIADTQPIQGTSKVVATATAHHGYTHGSIIIVDVSKGEDGWEPLEVLTPEIPFPEASYDLMHWMPKMPVPVIDSSSRYGLKSRAQAMAPYPINDTLFLCAYAPSGGSYQIYLIDAFGGRELIYGAEQCSAAIPIRPRPMPRTMPSSLPQRAVSNTGTLFVQDVYQNRHVDEKNPLPRGTIKSLRVNQVYMQPTRQHYARGAVANEVIKRPLGTVPVEENGSVAFRVPAGVPLQLQALDENGMAVMTMRSFIYMHAGEMQTCVGCHEQRTSSPTRPMDLRARVHRLKPVAGVDYDDQAFSFTRTVQPVLDRHCIGCHGLGGKTADGRQAPGSYVFSIRFDEEDGNNRFSSMPNSYRELLRRANPRLAHRNGETPTSVPRDYFSPTSKLPPMLLEGHHGLQLDREDFARIVTWLDLNSQCYGTYLPNREEQRLPDPAGEAALRAYVKQLFGAELSGQPLGALVNPTDLDESRILKAPLSEKRGGWGQIADGFDSTDDPRYKRLRDLAAKAYQPLPYQNIDGTCGRDHCICGNCWIREMVDADLYHKQLEEELAAAEGESEGGAE